MIRRTLLSALLALGIVASYGCTKRYTNQPIVKVSRLTGQRFEPTNTVAIERHDVYFPKSNEVEVAEMVVTWIDKRQNSAPATGHTQETLMGEEFDELVNGFMVPRAKEMGADVVVVTKATVEKTMEEYDIEASYYLLGKLIKRF